MSDTPEYLYLFYYDATSPSHLRWAVNRYSGRGGCKLEKSVGDVAGDMKGDGYYRVPFNGKRLLAHRVVWELVNGRKLSSNEMLDHKDGCRSNNSPSNLRLATRTTNNRNQKKRATNKTGSTGVSRLSLNDGLYEYYVASWTEEGKRRHRTFSINALGEKVALKEATTYRQGQIERLNRNGAGYTDRHNQKGE